MAINRGVLGTQTGSMGGITASNWKGRNVYKQKVPARNSSNSPAQALQRQGFALLAVAAGKLGSAIRIGYKVAAATVTEQNAFTTRNAPKLINIGDSYVLDYSQLEVSTGVVAPMVGGDIAYTTGTGATVLTWDNNSNGADALPSDTLCVMLKSGTEADGPVQFYKTNILRSAGTSGALQFVAGENAGSVFAYAFFKRATSTATSPSVVVGNFQ